MNNKKYILPFLFVALVIADTISAQQILEWQHHYGGGYDDRADAMAQTADGGFILFGFTSSNNIDVSDNNGGNDFWLVKTDSEGVLLWEQNLGGAGLDEGRDIRVANDGGYIMIGSSPSSNADVGDNNGNYDYWVVKTNQLGQIEWETNLGGSENDRGWSITPSADGGYVAMGHSYSDNLDISDSYGSSDIWVVKLDNSGALLWEKNYGGSGRDRSRAIQQTSDNGYILLGVTDSLDGDVSGSFGADDFWVVKIDATGDLEWEKSYGGTQDDNARTIKQTNDGGYIVGGSSLSSDGDVSNNYGAKDIWVFKIDANGAMEWDQNYGGPNNDNIRDIQQTADGGYAIAGESVSTSGDISSNNGGYDFWLIKVNAEGLLEWEQTYGGSNDELLYAIELTPYNGYVLAGYSRSDDGDVGGNHGLNDFWIVKIQDCIFPEIDTAQLYLCEETIGSGTASFNLSNIYDSLATANGLTTIWFLDQEGTIPVNNTETYFTDDAIVYLQFTLGSCLSELIPIHLIVNPQSPVILLEETICPGDAVVINDQLFNASGNYNINMTNEFGCDSIVILDLEVIDIETLERAHAGVDQIVTVPNASLSANIPIDSYGFWSSPNAVLIEDEMQAITSVSDLALGDNIFIWSLEHSICGVYDSDTVLVNYYLEEEVERFFLPNTFTPNGDGSNDLFRVPGLYNNGATYRFSVFNRQGTLVYQVENYQNDWDGKNRADEDLLEGTYYFVLQGSDETVYKSSVLIVR